MADKIFGQGLDPIPLKLVPTPAVIPAFGAEPRPVYIEDLPGAAEQGAAVANATDEASAVTQLNALLASLRAADIIAT